ncbi:MAG TPA: metallophosphoesterase family protein [Anaerolineales bacterium]|nr:metallophosphoesterase family protein [Anaerolineales bacterium]
MRILVLSDVHGNCLALETVLEHAKQKGFDQIICNGDMIQGGPQPHETVQLLREMKCPIVIGNSDAWLLTGVETDADSISEERRKKLNLVREWSLDKLTEEDRAFIHAFHPTVIMDLGHGKSLLAFHGSPTSFDQILLPSTPEDEFQNTLKPYAGHILTGGHVHLQYTRRLCSSSNFYFNPGSVGVAFNHAQENEQKLLDPWAEYAILTQDSAQTCLEFVRVDLDMDKVVAMYRESDRPFANEMMGQYTPNK